MLIADYTDPIDPAALKAAGISGVSRYLSWPFYWEGVTHDHWNPKIIRPDEYHALIDAGLSVTLNWEFDARDWLSGPPAAQVHASEAVVQARAMGYPQGCVIVGSADFDMTRQQWDVAGSAYAARFRDVLNAAGYQSGVYGPWDVLSWVTSLGGYHAFWQAQMSWAWSNGRNAEPWPGAQLRQVRQQRIAGQVVDISEVDNPNWGQSESTSSGGTDMDAEQARQLLNVYNSLVFGGSSLGPPVEDPLPEDRNGNSIGSLLQHIRRRIDMAPTPPVPSADEIAAAIIRQLSAK